MHSPQTYDAFSKVLGQLQCLHDSQVSQLATEVARLRAELQRHRCRDNGTQHKATALQSNGEANAVLPSPDPLKTEQRRLPETLETACREVKEFSPCALDRQDPVEAERRRLPDTLEASYTEVNEISPCAPGRHSTSMLSETSVPKTISAKYSDLLNPSIPKQGWRVWCYKLVSMKRFDMVMGIVIVLNAVTIGIETSLTRSGEPAPLVLYVFEYCFLGAYVLEVGMRFASYGCQVIHNNWVKFDIFLVVCGILHLASEMASATGSMAILDTVMLVRVLRLARLARALRLMIKFHTLWMLVQGLMNSLVTLLWTGLTICILLFIFSVLGLEVLVPAADAGDEYNRIVSEHFGSLPRAMITLLQGLTLDSFGAVYGPVMRARPFTVFYFVPFLLVVSIALMNLVTALMVNFSLEQATRDKQAQEDVAADRKARLIGLLEEAFRELDLDGNGQINLEDMRAAPADVRELICDIADLQESSDTDMVRLFKTLDYDGSGTVEISEFCEGLLKFQEGSAFESYRVMKQCNNMVCMLKSLAAQQGDIGIADIGLPHSAASIGVPNPRMSAKEKQEHQQQEQKQGEEEVREESLDFKPAPAEHLMLAL